MRRTLPVTAVLFTVAGVIAAVAVPVASAQEPSVRQTRLVSSTPATNTPKVLDGQVNAIAVLGSDIVIGGTFTQLQDPGGSATTTQPYLAAFNATTGAIDQGFRPALNGLVNSIDVAGSNLVVGGEFTTVDGVGWKGLTEVTVSGARVTTFTSQVSGIVNSVAVRAGRLYIGGRFTTVGGVARIGLAALNPATGVVDPAFNLPVGSSRSTASGPFVKVLDVSPNGATLVVGGNFDAIGGQVRRQLALISTATNKVTAWSTGAFAGNCSPNYITYVYGVGFSPDSTYFAVATAGGPHVGSICDSASRFENVASANQNPTWVDPTGGDSLNAVAVTGTAVYVGGHERWINNYFGANSAGPGAYPLGADQTQGDLAALDPLTGTPLPWGASNSPRSDPQSTGGGGVFALLATPTGLWEGFDTTTTVGSHQRIAFFPIAGGRTIPGTPTNALPGTVYISGTSLVSRQYTGSAFGSAVAVAHPSAVNWASVRGAFLDNGEIFYADGSTKLKESSFDGSTVGAGQPIQFGGSVIWSQVMAMTFNAGHLYYVNGDGRLYSLPFNGTTPIVSSNPPSIAGTSGYASVTSMFIAGGHLYWQSGGKLYRQAMAGAVATGSSTQVSGPGVDALTWTATSTFFLTSPAGHVGWPAPSGGWPPRGITAAVPRWPGL